IDVAPPAPDASSADASDGAPPESDAASPIDASDAADAATPLGLACAPAPEGIPSAAPPGPSAACSSAQIDAYLSDCLFNYDQTKCDQDYQASAACFDCIGTSED